MLTYTLLVVIQHAGKSTTLSLEVTGPLPLPDKNIVDLINEWSKTEYTLDQTAIPWFCIVKYPKSAKQARVEGKTIQALLQNIAFCLANFFEVSFDTIVIVMSKVNISDDSYWGTTYDVSSLQNIKASASPVSE